MSSQVRQNFHQDCEAAINRQINLELYASYVYLSMVSLIWIDIPINQSDGVCLNCGDMVFTRVRAIKQRLKFHLSCVVLSREVLMCQGKTCPYYLSLTLCAMSVLVIIISGIIFCLSRNWVFFFFFNRNFLLPGLLLWPGWPGIAQLCQVFPSSVTRGARARWKVNENAKPEGRKDLPARCPGKITTLLRLAAFFASDSGCIILRHPLSRTHNWGGVNTNVKISRACMLCHYLLLTHQHNPMTFKLNVKLQRPT